MMLNWGKACSTCCYRKSCLHYFVLSQRFILVLTVCFVVCITESMENNVDLISHKRFSKHPITFSNLSCPNLTSQVLFPNLSVASNESHHWTKFTQSAFRSCHIWGSILAAIPSGYLSTQFGGKVFLILGFTIYSLLHMLFPLAFKAEHTHYYFLSVFLLRAFFGVLEVFIKSAIITILSHWLPKLNRTLLTCVIFSTPRVLFIYGNDLTTRIVNLTDSVNVSFYLWGSLGIVCSLLLYFLCFSTPSDHPRITEGEKNFLEEDMEECVFRGKKKIPWMDILLSGPVWAITICGMGLYWTSDSLMNRIVQYLQIVLKLDLEYKLKWTMLHCWVVTVLFGCFCEWLNNENYISISKIRKYSILFTFTGCSVSLLFTLFSACHRERAFHFYSMAECFLTIIKCSLMANFFDIAPNFAGLVFAVTQTFYLLIFTLASIIISTLTTYYTYTDWRLIFWSAAGICLVSGYFYKVFASGDVQRWNYLKKT